MSHFDECFVTGTAAEVTPVREIDGIYYKPGEVCHALSSDYDSIVRKNASFEKF
jgi:branched-chain amino acid aminotransferase